MAAAEQWLGRDDKLTFTDVRSADRFVRLTTALAQLQVVRHVIWQDQLREQETNAIQRGSHNVLDIGQGHYMMIHRRSSERGGTVENVYTGNYGFLNDERYAVSVTAQWSVLIMQPPDVTQPGRAITAQALLESGQEGGLRSRQFAAHAAVAYEFVQNELDL